MNNRVYAFDFLKFIASILIVFHHYQQIVGLFFEGGVNFCWGRFNVGLLVEFFFLLSGFLMTGYVKDIQEGLSFRKFFGKRYFRLIPMLAGSVIVYEVLLAVFRTFGVFYLQWYVSTDIDVWGAIITALGLQIGGIFEVQTINTPTWYISVLLICYVIFYCLVRLNAKKKINLVFLCLTMIFIGLAIDIFDIRVPFLNEHTKRGYCPFFFGLIIGLWLQGRDSRPRETLFGTFLSSIVVAVLIFNSKSVEQIVNYLMIFIVYPSILLIFNLALIKKLFRGRLWKALGDISYGIYVWHINVLLGVYIWISVAPYPVSIFSLEGMIFFLILCFFCATVIHFVYEKPVTRFVCKRI